MHVCMCLCMHARNFSCVSAFIMQNYKTEACEGHRKYDIILYGEKCRQKKTKIKQ